MEAGSWLPATYNTNLATLSVPLAYKWHKSMKKQLLKPVICNRNGNLSKRWYVEFYYKDSEGGIKRSQIRGGGNRIKSKKGRQLYFQSLVKEIQEKLNSGWQPNEKKKGNEDVKNIEDALLYALARKKHLAKKTYNDYRKRINQFLMFLKSKNISKRPIEIVTEKQLKNIWK